jgi:Uma2 family endonuclease
VTALAAALRAALPGDLRAVTEIEVVLDDGSPPTVRVPDIAVLPATSLDDRARCAAGELVGVVEVLSPGTTRTDRVAKMAEYADARIPFYGIVDPERPVVLSEFRLVPGPRPHYEHVADHRGHATLPLDVPITVALEPEG